ncbi:MAG TPA: Ig-like domain-containing protein, partial [Mycobacteriales bacterium]|nr:Ig-like domain-containing protein [Mycobacteriales bacterium]
MTDSGTPVAGANVDFSTTSTGAAFGGTSSCTTGADGSCSVTVTKPDFGLVDVTAQSSVPTTAGGTSSTPVGSSTHTVAFQAPWLIAPVATSPPAVTVGRNGADLDVEVNGTTTARPADTVKTLAITTPANSALTVDKTAGVIAAPITINGGGGTTSLEVKGDTATWTVDHATGAGAITTPTADLTLSFTNIWTLKATGADHTLAGPATDTTWVLSAQGSGTMAASASSGGTVTYSGFTNLKGAPDNQDVFKVDTGGKIAGTIDGGDRGFDTMEIVGSHAS